MITAINERNFAVRINALDYLESISRQWERPYTSLRKERVAYALIVKVGIQVFDNLVGNL